MAAIAPITLADGQTTPANHVFNPVNPQQGSTPARWKNSEGTTSVGDRTLSISVIERATKFDVNVIIKDPVLSAIPENCCEPSNVPQIAYTDIGNLQFSIAKSSTLQNRKDILAYAKNVLASTAVQKAIENLEISW